MKRVAIALLAVLLLAAKAGAQTVTPNIGLQVPFYNQANWQVQINYDLNRLDLLLSGGIPLPTLNPTQFKLVPVTFSQLPTCASSLNGALQSVSDSTTQVWGATISGAGSSYPVVWAYCNGTNWVVSPYGGGGIPSGLTNPMSVLGDTIYGGLSGVGTRLAGNTTNVPFYLKSLGSGSVASAPAWTQILFSDISLPTGEALACNGVTVFCTTAVAGADEGARIMAAQNQGCTSSNTNITINALGETTFASAGNVSLGQLYGHYQCKVHLIFNQLNFGSGAHLTLQSGSSAFGLGSFSSAVTVDGTQPGVQNAYNPVTGTTGANIGGFTITNNGSTPTPPTLTVTTVAASSTVAGDWDYTITPSNSGGPINDWRGYYFTITGLASGNNTPTGKPFRCDASTNPPYGTNSIITLNNTTGNGTPQTLQAGTAVTTGYGALSVGGKQGGMSIFAPTNVTRTNNYIATDGVPDAGSYMQGMESQFAIYSRALSATEIATHYTTGSSGSNYETLITGTAIPTCYRPLYDTSGTAATELMGCGNGTYVGSPTLGSVAGIPGSSHAYAASFNGSSQYVQLPSVTSPFTGGAWSVEFWVQNVPSGAGEVDLFSFSQTGVTNNMGAYSSLYNGGLGLQVYNGGSTYQLAGNGQYPLQGYSGALIYVAYVYSNGLLNIYINGNRLRVGTDWGSSTFTDIKTGGWNVGVDINSQGGCDCYDIFNNVWGDGTQVGTQTLNNSGYGFGVNSNNFIGGGDTSGSPVGLFDSGGTKNEFYGPDFESNTLHGMVLAGTADHVFEPYEEAVGTDWIPGSFNRVDWSIGNGSVYSPSYGTGNTNIYGGPLTNVIFGPNAAPLSLGVSSDLYLGGHSSFDSYGVTGNGTLIQDHDIHDSGYVSGAYVLDFLSGSSSQIGKGLYGHATNVSVGKISAFSGASVKGGFTTRALANPTAPTITNTGQTGTRTYQLEVVGSTLNSTNPTPTFGYSLPSGFSNQLTNAATNLGSLNVVTPNGGASGVACQAGDSFTVVEAGGSSGTVTSSTVDSSGAVTAFTAISGSTTGSGYYPSSGLATTTSSGHCSTTPTVTITTNNVQATWPVVDGYAYWDVVINDTVRSCSGTNCNLTVGNNLATGQPQFAIAIGGTAYTILDYGQAYGTGYVAPTRNSTADASFGGNILTSSNCAIGGASGTVSPAACAAAITGVVAVPTATASYTVNTTAVTTNSRIFLQPTTDNTGIPSTPTCVAPLLTTDPTISGRVAGTGFTFAFTSTTGVTCWQYWIVN